MRKHIILTLLVCVLGSNIYAQWSKGKGNGYYKLSAWYLQSDQHYTDTGAIDSNATRTQFNTNIYAEYGISDRIDLIAYVPFLTSTSENNQVSGTTGEVISEGESVTSFGDMDIGINYGFYKKGNWAASVKLLLGLPTGDENAGTDGNFQTGDGEFNQYLSTSLGYSTSLHGLPFYAKSYLGYNNRSKGFSDEFRTGLEAGINVLNSKLWLITRLNILKSFKNGTLNAVNSNGSIFANNIEFSSFGFEAAYYFTKNLGVSASFDSAFSGSIIAANPSFSGGIFLDIK
ncbi:transporter [Tenacibaculum agarivorans]|uniref:transporter n=1 Tax=Tenacibaculum agarivorans TaxID=1908389 RepID=UPI000AEF0CAE|nr:transporter [Tenacibaculum agarivorans]